MSQADLDRARVLVLGPGGAWTDASVVALLERTLKPFFVLVVGSDLAASESLETIALHSGYFAQLVGRVTSELGTKMKGRMGDHVGRAVEYLAEHYGEAVTLSNVATAVSISESHLAHTFQAEIGMPPKQFVTALRLGVAEFLLQKGDSKVADIARRVGFFDGSHLSRVVRQHRSGVPLRSKGIDPRW